MKSIFPNADETLILECLQNNDNSIQKTSETLNEMGYSKKDTVKLSTPKSDPKLIQGVEKSVEKLKTPPPLPQLKTGEERHECKFGGLSIFLWTTCSFSEGKAEGQIH